MKHISRYKKITKIKDDEDTNKKKMAKKKNEKPFIDLKLNIYLVSLSNVEHMCALCLKTQKMGEREKSQESSETPRFMPIFDFFRQTTEMILIWSFGMSI